MSWKFQDDLLPEKAILPQEVQHRVPNSLQIKCFCLKAVGG